MKVSDASKSPQIAKARAVDRPGAAQGAPAPAPVDAVEILGIPEKELTPRVREALVSLMNEVRALRDELSQTRARIGELETIADKDPHLDVLNRRAFVRELNRAMALGERYGTPASLLFVDLNDLKKINDAHGHAAGDAALAHVAATLSANIRQTDAVGRLGGDEFGVILLQADETTAREKAASLAALVAARKVTANGADFEARISCGVFEIRKGLSADEALATADREMYREKRR